MTQTILAPGPAIPIPVPQASSWTLRIATNTRIRLADIIALNSDVGALVGGIDDSQWWIEASDGQVFSGRGSQSLNAALDNPPFTVVGFEVTKHSHPGFPAAHSPGQPHPQTPTVRLALVDLRRAREVTLESDDPTWVVGARGTFSRRVAMLPSTWLWTRRTTLLAPLVPAGLFGIVAHAAERSTQSSTTVGDIVNTVGIGAGIGFVLGGQVLEYVRGRRPPTFGGTASSPWLEAQWAVAANFVATLIVLVAAAANLIR